MFISRAEKELLFFRIEQLQQRVEELEKKQRQVDAIDAALLVGLDVPMQKKGWKWTPEAKAKLSTSMKAWWAKKKEQKQ